MPYRTANFEQFKISGALSKPRSFLEMTQKVDVIKLILAEHGVLWAHSPDVVFLLDEWKLVKIHRVWFLWGC